MHIRGDVVGRAEAASATCLFQKSQDIWAHLILCKGFPAGSAVKNLPANAGDVGSVPGLGRIPRGENGVPLQYSCLENAMDRGAWRATVHGVIKESGTT